MESTELVTEKHAKVGARLFPKGSKVSRIVEAAERIYDYWKNPEIPAEHPMTFTLKRLQDMDALIPQGDRQFVDLSTYLDVLAAKEQAELALERMVVANPVKVSLQDRMLTWCLAVFGFEITHDKVERNYRFLEEATELVQATGMSEAEAIETVRWVYARPIGEAPQEVAGAITTLLALCNAHGINAREETEKEINRIWENRDKIREKQKTKIRRKHHIQD